MEGSQVTSELMLALLKETADRGTGKAWVDAWNAVSYDGWHSVPEMIRRVYKDEPAVADRVLARFEEVTIALKHGRTISEPQQQDMEHSAPRAHR